MVHWRSETCDENTRWVSSQVVGDSTAQTVTIRSMGFMPEILCSSKDSTISNGSAAAKFRRTTKSLQGTAVRQVTTTSEVDAVDQPRLVTLEPGQVERPALAGPAAPRLHAPGRGHPRSRRQLQIGGRP